MATAVKRIVVQVTPQEKKAISAKAKRLGLSVAELMRRGAAAYEDDAIGEDLAQLVNQTCAAVERSAAAIDDALDSIEASNERIARMARMGIAAPGTKGA